MNNFRSSELGQELKGGVQATGYWNDEAVRQHRELAVLTQDTEQIEFFRELFNAALAQDDSNYHPMLPDPDPGEVDFGDILLGTLTTGGEVRATVNELLYNTLVVAPPGAGKTVLAPQIASQLTSREIAVHNFDTQNEYADVLAPLGNRAHFPCVGLSNASWSYETPAESPPAPLS